MDIGKTLRAQRLNIRKQFRYLSVHRVAYELTVAYETVLSSADHRQKKNHSENEEPWLQTSDEFSIGWVT